VIALTRHHELGSSSSSFLACLTLRPRLRSFDEPDRPPRSTRLVPYSGQSACDAVCALTSGRGSCDLAAVGVHRSSSSSSTTKLEEANGADERVPLASCGVDAEEEEGRSSERDGRDDEDAVELKVS